MSIAAQDKQLAWQRASVAEMRKSFDYAKLTPEAQTSYDVWIYQLEQAEAALRFRTNAYVFDQMSAIHSFFPQLLDRLPPGRRCRPTWRATSIASASRAGRCGS